MFWDIMFILGFGFAFASIGFFFGYFRGFDQCAKESRARYRSMRENLLNGGK